MSSPQFPLAPGDVLSRSAWVTVYRCVECSGRLSLPQVSKNGGTCPKCGFLGPKAGTFADVVVAPARWVTRLVRWRTFFGFRVPFLPVVSRVLEHRAKVERVSP